MRIVLCTGNAHKVAELRSLLSPLDVEPLDRSIEMPPETGDTFEANARIKAAAGAAANPDAWVVADDSGLEVDALDGQPGVFSARFAGPDATDSDNVELLLKQLTGVADRHARFVCVLVAIGPDGDEIVARGTVEGHIADAPVGTQGFGYDPVFVPSGEQRTYGELGDEVKSKSSHRAVAVRELATSLRALAVPTELRT
jgi:XTP/dITP diphosphohydrolase